MRSSIISTGELPPRKCDSVDMRNGAISSGHVTAGEWHQRNYRDDFHGNQMAYLPGRFQDMLPDMREIHSEASLYGAGRVHRGSVHLTCSCSGCQQPELFYDDHDHHQSSGNKRYRHGITGSSTPIISDQIGHPHDLCDRGCCGSVAMRRERSGGAKCMVDRTRARSRSSLSVDSLEFQRNATAVGGVPNFPLTRREVETKSFSLHQGFMANSPPQTKAPLQQIVLYGWHLMKPHREGHAADPSAFSSVAIGGYRNPRMEDQDFFETATVVERLERWKLRTRDGLEVGLMGMINIEKSVASGFSPSLVQCFMIGFPSAWIYMLLNMQKCVPKSCPGMPSPSASPDSSAGRPGGTANTIRDFLGTPITPEADLVQSILQSPLFTAGPDEKTRSSTLGGCFTAATTPIVETRDSRKRPRSELHSPVADISLVDPVVAPADSFHGDHQVGASPDVTEEKADAELDEELENQDSITAAATPTPPIVETRDSRNRPRSELHSPVADIPLVDAVVAPARSFHSDRQVGASPDDATEEKADARLDEELENEDSIMHNDNMDVEVYQSCKVKVEGRACARRKRYKISRNYYQRGKKKPSTKRNVEKVPPRSDKSTATVRTPIESTEVENDESRAVEEMIEPPKEKVDRHTRSTKRSTPKYTSSVEGPESSVENSQLKTSRQTKKSIVPPLPSPKVAAKGKVTEAFGLKRSLHGRVLVPPLATWRSQSIKYDMDGGILAISDGFTASDDENCTGYYNFKAPVDKGARKMQKRLCKAADTSSRKK